MSTAYYEKIVEEDLDTGTGTSTVRNPGGGTLVGTQINLATFAIGGAATTATWDPGSVAVGSKVSTTVTVSGAALGDHVSASFSLDLQELGFSYSVSAANTVEVVLSNNTSAAVNLASGTLSVLVFKVA
jgi:hypothetical protein